VARKENFRAAKNAESANFENDCELPLRPRQAQWETFRFSMTASALGFSG